MDNWRAMYTTMEVFRYIGKSKEVTDKVRLFPNAGFGGLDRAEEEKLVEASPQLLPTLDLLGGEKSVVPGWQKFLFTRGEFEALIGVVE